MTISMSICEMVWHCLRAEYFSHLHHLSRAATAPKSLVELARREGENVCGQWRSTSGACFFPDKKKDC